MARCSPSIVRNCRDSIRQPFLRMWKRISISQRARYQSISSAAWASVSAVRLVSRRHSTGVLPAGHFQVGGDNGQEIRGLQNELRDTDIRLKKLTNLVEETSAPGPLLRRLGELKVIRADIQQRLALLIEEAGRAKALAAIQESDVRKMLDALADDMATLNRDHLKDFIGTLIEGIYLDPATRAGEIRYRISQRSGAQAGVPTGIRTPVPTVKG